ncbi:thiamine diphosphokinase [Peribacillus kribbensis]|uniref:thiamine diphosphokinase n=1 Tax=Peribacillus kribbensis TaxID=356658 RepID=UPI00042A38C3|nr:thiamine diphosphokinase [Peribacillus kribbensis]
MMIYILAGGPLELVPDLLNYKNNKEIIWAGVDRGVYSLLQLGITPDKAFGDFDSVTGSELELLQTTLFSMDIYPAEKDLTDLEIALEWARAQNPDGIRIFGATGGRADHFLANIQLLTKSHLQRKTDIPIYIEDKTNIIYVKTPGSWNIESIPEKKYISFIPLTLEVKGITLKGFKYPLDNRNITMGSTLCISNELLSNIGTFSFIEGIILVVRSND